MRKITKKRKQKDLNPVYCSGCGRFLAYEAIVEGVLRIKCRHCKGWTSLAIERDETSQPKSTGL